MKFLNETITFLFEVLLLVGIWLFSFKYVNDTFFATALSVLLDAVIIVIWGLFLAPRASKRLSLVPGLVITSVLTAIGPIILLQVTDLLPAVLVVGIFVLNRVLSIAWKQW